MVGDLDDPGSRVAQMANREVVSVRRPEKETRPKLFYRGAHQATLDPLAARRPEGGLFMWSEQTLGEGMVVSGHPGHTEESAPNSSASALLSYDVPHRAPWDWRVSLYTLTKGLATGVYLVPLLLILTGHLDEASWLWRWGAPIISGVFLALTGLLLISDLEHPKRFYYIFTRPQWQSWLVRGAFIIGGYSAFLGLHFLASLTGGSWHEYIALPTALLATGTAIYTAYLFAQAKARDLWQSALLPPHLFVQALLGGSAILDPLRRLLRPRPPSFPLAWMLAISFAWPTSSWLPARSPCRTAPPMRRSGRAAR